MPRIVALVSAQEAPERIVPGGQTLLIVALEPGNYPGPWGMRIERLALITDAVSETLSRHDTSL